MRQGQVPRMFNTTPINTFQSSNLADYFLSGAGQEDVRLLPVGAR